MNPIHNFVNSGIVPPEVLRAARAISVMKKWEQVVGKEMAARSWPERYDHGTVWVAVVGSAWAQELRMQKDEILARLNTIANEPTLFVNARFGVRPLKKAVINTEPEREEDEFKTLTIREIAERRMREWHKDDELKE
ncbi:MAG: DUF721 domain-containing protein [Armatimonadetes bacterium]|nr:DUF721 domain-containing protein [Armatimonadota bacterium]MBS1702982.1 DUF721 domain-containing protein [Armatimonadota bacterium]